METEMDNVEAQTESTDTKVNFTFMKASLPVTLKFEDVVHKIKIRKGGGWFRRNIKSEERLILKSINGTVLPGELLAILGPSGSGKTTLLTALGHRLRLTSGSITYNGKSFSTATKRNTGFVAQNDVFSPYLSVTETLVFTALLRLPGGLAKEEKILRAEAVIHQLGLTKCKNIVIGGRNFFKGISGGERKRVSIGQELLMNPSLLFLDEPTTGLDSTVAKRIVLTLWELAKGGRTVVMTIHQPSSRLFYMFHKVLLLSEGSCLYFGKGECAMEYFSSLRYAPLRDMNPSDFLLDLANGISSGDSQENQAAVKKALASAYKSNLAHKVKAEFQDSGNEFQIASEGKNFDRWMTTWLQQFTVLLRRCVKERRHESFSAPRVARILVLALFAGFLWWQSDTANIQDQVGLLFFYNQFWGLLPLIQAISIFPHERRMLTKERSSGMYRLSSYFMARIVADLPMELTLPTLFVTITYWMGGLKATAINFFSTLTVVLFNVLVAQGLGLAIGAVVMNQKSAITLGSVIMLAFLLPCGYFVQNLPTFISWIKHGSLSLYIYKLLLGSQYKADDTYIYPCASNLPCLVGNFPIVKYVGLDKQGLSVVALGIMLIGYRLVAYFALMKVGVIHR